MAAPPLPYRRDVVPSSKGVAVREVLAAALDAVSRDEPCALATVVRTWHSAPRPAGTTMAVMSSGAVVGSVSGGCVEGAVAARAELVLADGVPARESYGVSLDDALAAGLTCGGTVDVLVERVDSGARAWLTALASSIDAAEPVVLATVVEGPRAGRHLVVRTHDVVGSSGDGDLDAAAAIGARERLRDGTTGAVRGAAGAPHPEILLVPFLPPAELYVVGAGDIAGALCRLGRAVGRRVTVVDARPAFATPERFPDADAVIVDRPDRWLASASIDGRTAVCLLTHEARFDVPALVVAVRRGAGYVGALGSRRTAADRIGRLRDAGLSAAEIATIRAPIGLDLGAVTPEETALSILSEIVQAGNGRTGRRLVDGQGPLHD